MLTSEFLEIDGAIYRPSEVAGVTFNGHNLVVMFKSGPMTIEYEYEWQAKEQYHEIRKAMDVNDRCPGCGDLR